MPSPVIVGPLPSPQIRVPYHSPWEKTSKKRFSHRLESRVCRMRGKPASFGEEEAATGVCLQAWRNELASTTGDLQICSEDRNSGPGPSSQAGPSISHPICEPCKDIPRLQRHCPWRSMLRQRVRHVWAPYWGQLHYCLSCEFWSLGLVSRGAHRMFSPQDPRMFQTNLGSLAVARPHIMLYLLLTVKILLEL